MMSVIVPMKKFDPLPIPFQSVLIKSVPIETESEKIGTRLIGISVTRCRYLDAFPYFAQRTGRVHGACFLRLPTPIPFIIILIFFIYIYSLIHYLPRRVSTVFLGQCDRFWDGGWIGFFWWAGPVAGLQVGQALEFSGCLGLGSAVAVL